MNLQDKMRRLRLARGDIVKMPLSSKILAIEGIILLAGLGIALITTWVLYFAAPHSIGIDAFLQ